MLPARKRAKFCSITRESASPKMETLKTTMFTLLLGKHSADGISPYFLFTSQPLKPP
jgi:hypothetical protein